MLTDKATLDRMMEAAQTGDTEGFREARTAALRSSVNRDSVYESVRRIDHVAIWNDHPDMAAVVYHQPTHHLTHHSQSPLWVAVAHDSAAVVRRLLDIHASTDFGPMCTALEKAIDHRSPHVARVLVERRRAPGPDKLSKLLMFCQHAECFKVLLESKADPNVSMRHETLLKSCVSRDQPDLAELLIDAKADVNAISKPYTLTPIHSALYKNNVRLVSALLRAGAHVAFPFRVSLRVPVAMDKSTAGHVVKQQTGQTMLEVHRIQFPNMHEPQLET